MDHDIEVIYKRIDNIIDQVQSLSEKVQSDIEQVQKDIDRIEREKANVCPVRELSDRVNYLETTDHENKQRLDRLELEDD